MQIEWLESLETRVREAADRLRELTDENQALKAKVEGLEERLAAGADPGDWETEREEIRRRVEGLTRTLEELIEV